MFLIEYKFILTEYKYISISRKIRWFNENRFYWIKVYFDVMKKSWYDKNIFYWIQIYFDWINNFGIMKNKLI